MLVVQCKIILKDILKKIILPKTFMYVVVKNIQVIYSNVMFILYFFISNNINNIL